MTNPLLPRSEREQTDESLRLERDRADRALDDEVSEADETADAVISRARARADALLAAARTKTDQTSIGDQPTDALKTSRAMEDHILQRERVTADHVLHRERSEHVTLLSQERQATDHDLSHERARSDKALAMRDDFMGIVSHDLLNLLNAMVGISSLIEKEVAQEDHVERVVAHARRVQRSGARMRRLVGDLVDVASIEAGMLAVTRAVGDPADVVTEAVETFQAEASGSGISLTAEIVPGVPSVAFDAARILQVLCNLLSNALNLPPLRAPSSYALITSMRTLCVASATQAKAFPMISWKRFLTASSSWQKMIAGAWDSVCSFPNALSRVMADKFGWKTE